jgi:hypothetical protein
MRGSFTYAGHVLPYRTKFSNRATLSISVLPDSSIEVVAPFGTTEPEIQTRLEKRGRRMVFYASSAISSSSVHGHQSAGMWAVRHIFILVASID